MERAIANLWVLGGARDMREVGQDRGDGMMGWWLMEPFLASDGELDEQH